MTYRIDTKVTVAGGFMKSETIRTIVFKFVREKLLDRIQPELYPSECMAKNVVFERESNEMAKFIQEIMLHDDGKLN